MKDTGNADNLRQAAENIPTAIARGELPSFIKSEYRRLALLNDEAQAASLDDGDTLIVTCDWLLSERLAADGLHCIHYEVGLLDWNVDEDLNEGFYVHVNEWVFRDGTDVTEFRGVSLGKCFTGEMSLCYINYYRLERSLQTILKRFSCREVVLVDYAAELNILGRTERRQIVENVCGKLGVTLIDDSARLGTEPKEIIDSTGASNLREWVLRMYALSLSMLSMVLAKSAASRVMLLVNTNLLRATLDGYKFTGISPVVNARTIPKRLPQLFAFFRRRIMTMALHPGNLDSSAKKEIAALRQQITAHVDAPGDSIPGPVRTFIHQRLLHTDKLDELAGLVITAERNFRRFRPSRVVVDGVRNVPNRIYIELAHLRGIEVDYIWHSPMVPMNNRMDALVGDLGSKPKITRCLSWGVVNNTWLDKIGASQDRTIVGSPMAGLYRNQKKARPGKIKRGNALVLQYTPQIQDMRGLNSNAFVYLIEVVRALRRQGFENITIKLHPGPKRWTVSYYEAVVEHFGLGCKVVKYGNFSEIIEWADIVVGPLPSGAMFETLAAGIPYYPFLIEPHGLDGSYYGDYPVFGSSMALEKALAGGGAPDKGDLLNALYATDDVENTISAFWEAVSASPAIKIASEEKATSPI